MNQLHLRTSRFRLCGRMSVLENKSAPALVAEQAQCPVLLRPLCRRPVEGWRSLHHSIRAEPLQFVSSDANRGEYLSGVLAQYWWRIQRSAAVITV
jgi:hypothetical protein